MYLPKLFNLDSCLLLPDRCIICWVCNLMEEKVLCIVMDYQWLHCCGFLLKLDLFYTLAQLIILELMFCQSANYSCNNGSFLHSCSSTSTFFFILQSSTVILTACLVHSSPLTSSITKDCHSTEVHISLDSQQQYSYCVLPMHFYRKIHGLRKSCNSVLLSS